MIRGFKYRLYPTPQQEAGLRRQVGVTRFVYNLALEQRTTFWRQYRRATGRSLSSFAQCRELTDLRREVPWIAEVARTPLEQALRDLDAAFAAFFAGRAKYPTPRRKGRHDGFRAKGCEAPASVVSRKWGEVHAAKIGRLRFRQTRPLPGEPINATFSLEADRWFVSFQVDIGEPRNDASAVSVGIDRGVANGIALSTGELFQIPTRLAAVERRRRRAQKVLARRKRGSNRRAKQKARIARLYALARRIRTDWQQRTTTGIVRRFGIVALEALNTVGMTARAAGRGVRQKAGLNRAILNVGWRQIETMLAYKLEASGGRLISVPAAFTSQTCACCGVIDKGSRESQARFKCTACGHEAHADVNAAINIRRASGPLLDGEGGHLGPPAEPSTMAA